MSIGRGMDRGGTYVQWITNQLLKKEQNNAICSNMDATRDYK